MAQQRKLLETEGGRRFLKQVDCDFAGTPAPIRAHQRATAVRMGLVPPVATYSPGSVPAAHMRSRLANATATARSLTLQPKAYDDRFSRRLLTHADRCMDTRDMIAGTNVEDLSDVDIKAIETWKALCEAVLDTAKQRTDALALQDQCFASYANSYSVDADAETAMRRAKHSLGLAAFREKMKPLDDQAQGPMRAALVATGALSK